MMTGFVRLAADGGGQLEDWGPMPSSDLIAGTGQQYGALWLDDAAAGLLVGVWACSPMTGAMGPWSTNEVMILIDGAVTIDHGDGSSLSVGAGDCFFIPKGTVCSWRQEGDLKKFFVIHSDASGLVPRDAAALRARKIDASAALAATHGPDPALLLSAPAPRCEAFTAFTDHRTARSRRVVGHALRPCGRAVRPSRADAYRRGGRDALGRCGTEGHVCGRRHGVRAPRRHSRLGQHDAGAQNFLLVRAGAIRPVGPGARAGRRPKCKAAADVTAAAR